jgi:hypothetical protein
MAVRTALTTTTSRDMGFLQLKKNNKKCFQRFLRKR